MKDFSGKVAFVTGGAGGIGLGLAQAFLRAGMRVAIADIRREPLERASRTLGADSARLHTMALDVTDRAQVAAACEELHRVFGRVHVLCANAGVADAGYLSDTGYDDWDWMMGVNLGGVINTVTSFLPRLLEHGEDGHIVATSSMGGLTPIPQSAVYCIAKSAVIGMMEALRMELASSKIGVSVLCPGLTRTGIFATPLLRPSTAGDSKPPPPAQPAPTVSGDDPMRLAMDPAEVGEKVVRGIRRNDLYILTHGELRDMIREQFEPILAAAQAPAPGQVIEALPGTSGGQGIPTPYPTAVGREPGETGAP
jgi:NAD(P)-dependent dehydrogenase (short-subunit alcohol dehydrogenase family)